ncbi:MAG TPA: GNAT family N-acetyltransferase [Candidatus Binatia bacterium]|nr:GNAT family N-acetyltransferase [Candidatus Binatia bacterium]
MRMEDVTLYGRHVRLEPLQHEHAEGLVAAACADPSLYQLSPVPRNSEEAKKYIDTALAWQEAGTALPFAIVRLADNAIIGSSRFWNIERWPWPAGHALHKRLTPNVCEIGYTWFTSSAIRTAANTESKLLMLAHAFEAWNVLRVCLHADERNQRSRAAIERIGGKFEGILRAHRMATDLVPRNSARYSITVEEWPGVKNRLLDRLNRP